ncbi:MAG TPA: TetR/AcrR family transcriptional regulator [bacterium]|nr:TetR/AcrR family transcriptional regulator [bacterium]
MSENTKRAILDGAKQLFIRFGKRKTSVDEIAHTAQVGKGTVYFHFKSKEEIWDTIVGEEVDKAIERITEALDKIESAREKLRTYIQIRYQVFGEELDILNIQQGVLDELFPEITEILGKLKTKEMEFLGQILTYGIERGEFREVDVELLSMILVAVLESTGEYWIKQVRLVGAEGAMNNLLNVFFHGLLKID